MFSVFISEAQPILGNAKVCKPREEKRSSYFFLPKRSLFYQKIVQTEVIEKKEALHHEVPLNALSFKVAYL